MPRLLLFAALAVGLSACGFFGGGDEEVRVVAYDGPPLTAADAQELGADIAWELAEVDTDVDGNPRVTLVLQQVDEEARTGERYLIRLVDDGGALPGFDAAFYEERVATPDGGVRETRRGLRSGSVAIQDFDLDGVVSGQTSGDLQFTFYYDFRDD